MGTETNIANKKYLQLIRGSQSRHDTQSGVVNPGAGHGRNVLVVPPLVTRGSHVPPYTYRSSFHGYLFHWRPVSGSGLWPSSVNEGHHASQKNKIISTKVFMKNNFTFNADFIGLEKDLFPSNNILILQVEEKWTPTPRYEEHTSDFCGCCNVDACTF